MRFRSTPISPVSRGVLDWREHDAVHLADVGLLTASDEEILAWAGDDKHVVLSADSDFLAPRHQADFVLARLPQVGEYLATRAIVTGGPPAGAGALAAGGRQG